MLAFFYSIFRALMTGEWNLYRLGQIDPTINQMFNKVSTFAINALGGNFQTLQTFTFIEGDLTAINYIALVMAIVAMVSVCALTFKLIKMVFSIFFGGR